MSQETQAQTASSRSSRWTAGEWPGCASIATMAPRLMERQLVAGAWGLTVANVRQARVALACGARRIVIANEVTVARDLAWVCAQTAGGEVEIIFCVDSLDGLARAWRAAPRGARAPREVAPGPSRATTLLQPARDQAGEPRRGRPVEVVVVVVRDDDGVDGRQVPQGDRHGVDPARTDLLRG